MLASCSIAETLCECHKELVVLAVNAYEACVINVVVDGLGWVNVIATIASEPFACPLNGSINYPIVRGRLKTYMKKEEPAALVAHAIGTSVLP